VSKIQSPSDNISSQSGGMLYIVDTTKESVEQDRQTVKALDVAPSVILRFLPSHILALHCVAWHCIHMNRDTKTNTTFVLAYSCKYLITLLTHGISLPSSIREFLAGALHAVAACMARLFEIGCHLPDRRIRNTYCLRRWCRHSTAQ
jgi:hypothetical protein